MQLAALLRNFMIKNTVVLVVACTCYIGLKSIRPLICPSFLLESMHGAFTVKQNSDGFVCCDFIFDGMWQ